MIDDLPTPLPEVSPNLAAARVLCSPPRCPVCVVARPHAVSVRAPLQAPRQRWPRCHGCLPVAKGAHSHGLE